MADSARSQLSFRARAFGLIWVHGHMPAVGGTIHVSEGRLRGTSDVAASRISTGLRARDWHQRTRHYLHAARHPDIQLAADADIASGHADFRVIARGKPASIGLELDSARVGDGILRLQAHGTIDRSPFGMLPPAVRRVPARLRRTDRGGHASRDSPGTTVKARLPPASS